MSSTEIAQTGTPAPLNKISIRAKKEISLNDISVTTVSNSIFYRNVPHNTLPKLHKPTAPLIKMKYLYTTPLVQMQYNFTEMFLTMPSTKSAQGVPLH